MSTWWLRSSLPSGGFHAAAEGRGTINILAKIWIENTGELGGHGGYNLCGRASKRRELLREKIPQLLMLCYAKSLQLCPTLFDPIDGSPQGSPVPGILHQEHWSGLSFPSPVQESEKWKWSRSNCVRFLATPGTAAYQAPPSRRFSRQEYWSGVPLPSPPQLLNDPFKSLKYQYEETQVRFHNE